VSVGNSSLHLQTLILPLTVIIQYIFCTDGLNDGEIRCCQTPCLTRYFFDNDNL